MKIKLTLTMAAVAFGVSACSTTGNSSGSSGSAASNNSSGLSIFSSSGYHLPPFEEKTLANGLRVLFVPDDTLPYVSYTLLIKTGVSQDPEGQWGLASMVAELLDKGTAKRSATQIADQLGLMGAEFDTNVGFDYTLLSTSSISPVADRILDNMLEIVMQPAFSDQEVERVRKQMISAIDRRVDSADSYADHAFAQYLYGDHPYGRSGLGTVKSVSAIKKKSIIQYFLKYYRPDNSLLAVTGKFTPELKAKIEQGFGAWEKRELTPAAAPSLPTVQGQQFRLVDKPGLVQAQIRIGSLGIKRDDPDFLALRMANTILGGAFESRLMNRIRKELGLTYSINSMFDARRDVGPFEVETFTKNATVGQTVSETLKVLSDFRANGVNSSDVERAKGYMKGVFPAAIETPEKLATNLLLLRLYGLPDTYLTRYLKNVDSLSVSDINHAIERHIDPKNLKILVYSNAADVLAQMEAVAGPGHVEVIKASELNAR